MLLDLTAWLNSSEYTFAYCYNDSCKKNNNHNNISNNNCVGGEVTR